MTRLSSQRGFTLLEILIAVAIFALVSTATFTMLQQTIKSGERFDNKAAYLVQLQRGHRLLQQDFSQVVPRSIRDEYGDALPAVMSEEGSWGTAIEFTRTGRPNPLNKPRSKLLRLRYFFDGDKVIRRTWKHLDRAPEAEYQDQIVLENVKTWQVRFLSEKQWLASWPPETENSKTDLPSAFEIKLTVENEREFRWLFSVFNDVEPKL
ncbi:MAG: type II secretion system minor pseudopilin GspJ [Methylococcaceae bacterium]|nr:type II secretion system minor pseudopilin GspJ [Methylococcaceae bacterium]